MKKNKQLEFAMGGDIIVDILTFIVNANMNKKGRVQIAFTNLTKNFVKILLRENFLKNVRKHKESQNNFLVSIFRHRNTKKQKKIKLKHISQPSRQIYSNYQRIPKILDRIQIIILSTSQDMMTNREARLEKIGGEIVLYMMILL